MTNLKISMPWGEIKAFTVDATPRLGEYMYIDLVVYAVIEIRHAPASNTVMIFLRGV